METVKHLMNCPMYAQPRNEVFGHENVIKDLNSEPKKMLKFLKKMKRDTPLLSIRQNGATDGDRPLPSLGTGSADDEEEGRRRY